MSGKRALFSSIVLLVIIGAVAWQGIQAGTMSRVSQSDDHAEIQNDGKHNNTLIGFMAFQGFKY